MEKAIIFIIGVSGSGKTTLGKLVAQKLAYPFFDGDDFHPSANIEKMAKGIPLTDADRLPWLERLNDLAKKQQAINAGAVIATSALKETYRIILRKDIEPSPLWIVLNGSYDLIWARMQNRKNHFMPPTLLQSQFDAFEIPAYGYKIDISLPPVKIMSKIIKWSTQYKIR